MICPFIALMIGSYSPSGSAIMISSFVDRIKNSISSFVRKDLPDPGIPNTKEFGFCNKALLQRIGLLVMAF